MNNEILLGFQVALRNYCVIAAVVVVVAGPVFGVLGLRSYESARQEGSLFVAIGALVIFAVIPAVMLSQLITNPRLSLVEHREQAERGIMIGFLVLVGGGIALAIESYLCRARKEAAKPKPSDRSSSGRRGRP